jgi:FdhD protein
MGGVTYDADAVEVNRWRREAGDEPGEPRPDEVATEVPIALTYNRASHVVMMATPRDLEDFAVGFSVTEGLVGSVQDILGVHIIPRPGGLEAALTVTEEWFDRLSTRRRNLAGRTGCGLCGAENIEQALRPPAVLGDNLRVSHRAIERAVGELERHQPLQSRTGASHGAAWCSPAGDILLAREDVGRHNALDKLIGALLRAGRSPSGGFALVSSRASYEMVYKTAAAGMEMMVAVSAPTRLAVDYAEQCGLTLVGFARPGRHNVYAGHERIIEQETSDAGN